MIVRMAGVLRVLVVDDNEDDAELVLRELRRGGLSPNARRIDTAQALRAALRESWDIVIADWSMPGFDGLSAFKIVREVDADLPFIIVSGTVDEDVAVTALKAGVQDFVGKAKLTRLVPAVERECREAETRRKQRVLVTRGEERYRAMFNSSPLPMWTFDRDTLRFVSVNDAAVRHYGYTREEFLAMTLADIRPPTDVKALRDDVKHARGFADRQVWRHRKKDGSLISVELRANDITVDGQPLRLVLVNDVTERERPDRRPLGLWIGLASLVAVAILTVVSNLQLVRQVQKADHTHRLIAEISVVSETFDEVLEEKPRAATVAHLHQALDAVRTELALDLNSDDATQRQRLDRIEAAITAGDRALATSELETMQGNASRVLVAQQRDTAQKASAERIAQIVATLISLMILWVAFSRTAREGRLRRAAEAEARQSEESLTAMLHSIGDGVISTDVSGNVTRMNRVAEALTGWTTSDAVGRPFTEVFRIIEATSRTPATDPIELVLRDGRAVGLDENTVLLSRANVETPVADSAAPILDAANQVVGAVVVFRDASVERRFTEQLRELNEELERRVVERTTALQKTEEQLRQSQKLEAIGRLAGGIAHDFNNLLSVIISLSDLMIADAQTEKLPPTIVSDLDEIRKAGFRAADLTRQLLAFSRQQVLEPKIVDMNEIVAGMEKMLRRVIGADITLRTIRATDGSLVKVDPGQMEQVIMNLVVNARDAMPRGGQLTLEVARTQLDATFAKEHAGIVPGPYLQLAVSDTGTGMSKEVQARIFEPFFTTKEKGKGTGLGLSTVVGIVQQSGGTIWVYSEPGKGTTFKIYLPITAQAQTTMSPAQPAERPRGSETILLVEDEPQVRSIARGILTRAGYTVLDAENGAAALDLVADIKTPIDLVLTDLVMPVMSGRELVEKLAKIRPSIKVLFMSGYTDDMVVHHGVIDQGIPFLQKPLMPDSLTRKVREALDRRS
jgi:PAS domain S-box-containing protein